MAGHIWQVEPGLILIKTAHQVDDSLALVFMPYSRTISVLRQPNAKNLKIFRKLKLLSEYRRHQLPFVRTLEDMDIVREIGLHQVEGTPLTLKVLLLTGIASSATLHRRLARLRRLGIVVPKRASHDGRVVKLMLSAEALSLFRGLERALSVTSRQRRARSK